MLARMFAPAGTFVENLLTKESARRKDQHEFIGLLCGVRVRRPRSLRPGYNREVKGVKAEAVPLLRCESMGMANSEYCRSYIQEWGKGQAITERSAQRIFRAADQILRSGRTEQATRDAG